MDLMLSRLELFSLHMYVLIDGNPVKSDVLTRGHSDRRS
jgi:hypothetical protein